MSDQPMAGPWEAPPAPRLRGGHRTGSHHRRRLDDMDVDYWRKRAGWADDDATMKSYNQGVYNTYYMGDDDESGGSSGRAANAGKKAMDHLGWILGLASTLIFLVMLVKCCSSAPSSASRKGRTSSVKSRDSSRSIRDKHGERRSRSRSRAASSRSRSKSKSRARSKSRGRGSPTDYKLMDDEDDAKSRKSTKSSRSGRSRSRSRARSKSKSRSKSRSKSKSRSSGDDRSERSKSEKKEKKDKTSLEQKMLV